MSVIANRIDTIISSYNQDREKNFNYNPTAVRVYLIAKLTEEFGEYCEVAGMNMFVTDRKAIKHKLVGDDGKIDPLAVDMFLCNRLYTESGDLVWMALSLAFLEGHTMESLANYLETRKDAANKTIPTGAEDLSVPGDGLPVD